MLRSLSLLLLTASAAHAHPLFLEIYDRTVTVRVTDRAVVVDYLLEVDAMTVYLNMQHLVSREELAGISRQEDVYRVYHQKTAPMLAGNLNVKLDGRPLTLTCTRQRWKIKDEHPAFEFTFEARLEPLPGQRHRLTVRDNNYDGEKGALRLSLSAAGATVHERTQPDEALLQRAATDLRPGDEDRLRTVAATFEPAASRERQRPEEQAPVADAPGSPPTTSLVDLLFQPDRGLWLLLTIAAFLGGAHALTPGHGKTLVAAYLVGQRGTVAHAVLLGVVTALAHTGGVLLVAALLPLVLPGASQAAVYTVLSFVAGLMITGLGFWLMMRRLAGQADHVHLFGGHHHHHHDHDHDHHHHHHVPPDQPVTLRSLVSLGIAGGIVPCPEAVALLAMALDRGQAGLALPLLLAFSAGLAAVLVAVGIGVVWARRWSLGQLGESPRVRRISRLVTVVSAVVIIVLGIGICYNAVHGGPPG